MNQVCIVTDKHCVSDEQRRQVTKRPPVRRDHFPTGRTNWVEYRPRYWGSLVMVNQLLGKRCLDHNPFADIGVSALPPTQETASTYLRECAESTGFPCFLVDRVAGSIVSQSQPDLLLFDPAFLIQELGSLKQFEVIPASANLTFFALPVESNPEVCVAGYVLPSHGIRPAELLLPAIESGWSEQKINAALDAIPVCDPKTLGRLLSLIDRDSHQKKREVDLQLELNSLSEQIDYSFEEISLLHRLTHNLQLSRPREELAEMCVRGLYDLIECAGATICLEDQEHGMHVASQGRLPFDQNGLKTVAVSIRTT